MNMQVKPFRSLGGCMSFQELTLENAYPEKNNLCSPDSAAMRGNIVSGVFEIV
jgi:hypothetical protein